MQVGDWWAIGTSLAHPRHNFVAIHYAAPMYTATFTFAKRQFDDEFHALDQVIARTAKSLPGYLGEES